MFKLFKGELKKIFLRPSIFIMTLLLAIIITFSYYFYQPTARVDTSIKLNGNSVSEIYGKFIGNDMYSKADAKAKLNSSLNLINSYNSILVESGENSPLANIKLYLQEFNNLVRDWNEEYKSVADKPTASTTLLKEKTQNLKNCIDTFYSYFSNVSQQKNPIILLTLDTYSQIDSSLNNLQKVIDNCVNVSNRDNYRALYQTLLGLSTTSKLANFNYNIDFYINKIEDVKIASSFVESLRFDYYDLASQRLDEKENQIITFVNGCTSEEEQLSMYNKNKLNGLISHYYAIATQMYDILTTKIKLEIAKPYTENQFVKYINCADFNRYKYQQMQVRQQFLFDKNEADYNYATSLSFSSVSNFAPNAFDFTYFVLELFSFMIIIYCIVLGSGMIAGEQNSGTLKLLAIRPFSRGKILFSKIFATMFFMIIFVALSAIISMIAGSVLFGMESMPILLIYDASIPIVASPIAVLLLYIISLIIRISVYIILSFALSTILKSNIASTTVSIVLVFVTSIFGMFFTKTIFFKYLPLNNLDLFKFFGGGRFPADNTSLIGSLFSSPILPDTTFLFTFWIICITIALLLVLTTQVFKNRDIA